MHNKKVLAVYDKIKDLTLRKKISWKEEADGQTFFTSVSDFKVYIDKSVGTVSFQVINSQNVEIGVLEQGGYSPETKGLDVFYEEVRRSVQNSDDDLDELLANLDQLD